MHLYQRWGERMAGEGFLGEEASQVAPEGREREIFAWENLGEESCVGGRGVQMRAILAGPGNSRAHLAWRRREGEGQSSSWDLD